MHLPRSQVEGSRNQPQGASENKRGAHRFRRRESRDQKQSRDGKTTATDAGQPDRNGNQEAQEQMNHSERSENVWIPHSSFLPPQRPARGLLGSSGIAVHGSQPMLR